MSYSSIAAQLVAFAAKIAKLLQHHYCITPHNFYVIAAKTRKLLQQPPNLYHPCFYACSKNSKIAANPYNPAASPPVFTSGQATFMWLKVWYCSKTTHFCSNFLVFAATTPKISTTTPTFAAISSFSLAYAHARLMRSNNNYNIYIITCYYYIIILLLYIIVYIIANGIYSRACARGTRWAQKVFSSSPARPSSTDHSCHAPDFPCFLSL